MSFGQTQWTVPTPRTEAGRGIIKIMQETEINRQRHVAAGRQIEAIASNVRLAALRDAYKIVEAKE